MLNFTKVTVTELDGTTHEVDLSKEYAQIIHGLTEQISHLAVAIDLYKHGEVANTPENVEVLNAFKGRFLAKVQVGIDEIINAPKPNNEPMAKKGKGK